VSPAGRRFDCRSVATLPRLAWCAEVRAGAEAITVWHGPWVEMHDDWIVEGAWDGEFREGRFDRALALAGTGARLEGADVVFFPPTHLFGRLWWMGDARRVLVSNSLAFLLVRAGDAPDPCYRDYAWDFVRCYRAGITDTPKTLPTAARQVCLQDVLALRVRPDLSVVVQPRADCTQPGSFTDYRARLLAVTTALVANARDPGRRRPLEPLVELSRGYDSAATAVIAAEAGCRRSVSLRDARVQPHGDSGVAIARRLGLEAREHDRLAWRELPGLPEAEFALAPFGQHVVMAAAEPELEGALLISGRDGDEAWSRRPRPGLPQLRRPGATTTPGGTFAEFRLRVGFAHFALPAIGQLHHEWLHALAHSPELQPWSVGGDYDRPVARRIAEEGGIPRGMLGQRPKGQFPSLHLRSPAALTPASRQDNETFRRALLGRLPWRRRVARRTAQWLHRRTPLWRVLPERFSPLYDDPLFLVQWGFSHLRERYVVPDGP
jgi:hypothetical protein